MTAVASARIAATMLPTSLDDLRSATVGGRVLAAFERSAYLDLDGRVVALASANLAAGPLTINIKPFGRLRGLVPGREVTLSAGLLHVGAVAIDLRPASMWDPELAADGAATFARAPAARRAAVEELLAGAPDGSIAALLMPEPPAGGLLQALGRGLDALGELFSGRGRPDTVAQTIGQDIAGRGPGLTPSGDDLLIGILHALVVWPELVEAGKARDVRDLIATAARSRTTRISGAYLEAAGHGWAAEPWHALVRAFRDSPAATRVAVRRLLRIGETSGADALTGFCWAWRRGAGDAGPV